MYHIGVLLFIGFSFVQEIPAINFENDVVKYKKNKGVLIKKSYNDGKVDKSYRNNYIFRPSSMDIDNFVETAMAMDNRRNFDTEAGFPIYFDRTKRSSSANFMNRIRKSITKPCKTDPNCVEELGKGQDLKPGTANAKIISQMKPATIFNDYPYEISVLLNNFTTVPEENAQLNEVDDDVNKTNINVLLSEVDVIDFTPAGNKTSNNSSNTPKRSTRPSCETEIIKKLEFAEDLNTTDIANNKGESNKFNREIFSGKVWVQNAPAQDASHLYTYTVNPKSVDNTAVQKIAVINRVTPKLDIPEKNSINSNIVTNQAINDKGLVKIVTMLTRALKKIMKQHEDLKIIYKKFSLANKDFSQNVGYVNAKLQDFEAKYNYLAKYQEKITELHEKLMSKEEGFEAKDKELSKNLIEFELQQKKFLAQQKQFYDIQKLMLAQNEKINAKQTIIAKTQNDIAFRQHNFAKIFKKIKSINMDNRRTKLGKFRTNYKQKQSQPNQDFKQTTPYPNNAQNYTTTTKVVTTSLPEKVTIPTNHDQAETIKINLFSIPTMKKLKNQDEQILSAKDSQSVDDLVYKFYFNNTFIDTLMKTGILASILSPESFLNTRNVKKRTDEESNKSTVLLPIREEKPIFKPVLKSLKRERRWIRHSKKEGNPLVKNSILPKRPLGTGFNEDNNNPYVVMARKFCTQIGQNTDKQVLSWCIEKSLRKLQYVDLFKKTAFKWLNDTEIDHTTEMLRLHRKASKRRQYREKRLLSKRRPKSKEHSHSKKRVPSKKRLHKRKRKNMKNRRRKKERKFSKQQQSSLSPMTTTKLISVNLKPSRRQHILTKLYTTAKIRTTTTSNTNTIQQMKKSQPRESSIKHRKRHHERRYSTTQGTTTAKQKPKRIRPSIVWQHATTKKIGWTTIKQLTMRKLQSTTQTPFKILEWYPFIPKKQTNKTTRPLIVSKHTTTKLSKRILRTTTKQQATRKLRSTTQIPFKMLHWYPFPLKRQNATTIKTIFRKSDFFRLQPALRPGWETTMSPIKAIRLNTIRRLSSTQQSSAKKPSTTEPRTSIKRSTTTTRPSTTTLPTFTESSTTKSRLITTNLLTKARQPSSTELFTGMVDVTTMKKSTNRGLLLSKDLTTMKCLSTTTQPTTDYQPFTEVSMTTQTTKPPSTTKQPTTEPSISTDVSDSSSEKFDPDLFYPPDTRIFVFSYPTTTEATELTTEETELTTEETELTTTETPTTTELSTFTELETLRDTQSCNHLGSPMIPTSTATAETENVKWTPELATTKRAKPYNAKVTADATKKSFTTAMMTASKPSTTIFFPDNDALESNLKQFDLDYKDEIGKAGNVYDDGSLHASQMAGDEDAISDIMPGMDSNSRVEIDPRALELQAKRRAFVQKYNQAILNKIKSQTRM